MLTFRAEKVKENQGLSQPRQAGVGIDVLPLILSQKTTVNATISEPLRKPFWGRGYTLYKPLFFKQDKAVSYSRRITSHGNAERKAKKRGVSRTFRKFRIGAVTQAKAVCLCQFAKTSVFDTSKDKVWQGNMHCLPLAHQNKINIQKRSNPL